MTAPKPSDIPFWATLNQQNAISGQFNVVQPTPEKIQTGYNLGEKPNRQYLNYQFRTIADWIAYFEDRLDFDSSNVVPTWTGLTNVPTKNYFYYSKVGDKVFFTCNVQWASNVDVNPLVMTNLPFTAKNQTDFLQAVTVTRGEGATNAGNEELAGLIDGNATTLKIWKVDVATGIGSNLVASSEGQFIISGFYFIEV